MENASELLIIILASFLSLFLLLNIILLVLLIKVVSTVKRVTRKAEDLADKAEALGDFVQHASTPLVMGKVFSAWADTFFSKARKSKRK